MTQASSDARFVSVNRDNVVLADGKALPSDPQSLGWSWNAAAGNGGVWETSQRAATLPEFLMMRVDGLEPGGVYEVFGYFWADGFDGVEMNERQVLPMQFGCTVAELQTYDGPTPRSSAHVGSWMVAPGVNTGKAYGYQAVIEEKQPLAGLDSKLVLNDGGARLVRARMGLSQADKSGSLPVFFASYPYLESAKGSSRIDGVALRKVGHQGPLEMGWKAGTRLHLAIRAGDPVTLRRELEAGVDVNVLDEQMLSPLFYACGINDFGLVKDLLDRGADPNRAGQSLLPLSAAAGTCNTELVEYLLESGAQVPLTVEEGVGLEYAKAGPAYSHPAVTAIHSGSLPVLKLLLDAAPELDPFSLVDEENYKKLTEGNKVVPKTWESHVEPMQCGAWELAAFLINRGSRVDDGSKGGSTTTIAKHLIPMACSVGDEGWPVADALIRKGFPPVLDPRREQYEEWRQRGILYPFYCNISPKDGLAAAVWNGHAGLVERLLPEAKDVTPAYEDLLLMMAMHGRNPDVEMMVRKRFPEAKPARWSPGDDKEQSLQIQDQDVRLFLPRTSPPPRRSEAGAVSGHVIAVLASPEASGPGDLLLATASTTDGWQAVDREQVAAALAEGELAKPWINGEFRLSDLGDRLAADVLMIVRSINLSKSAIYCFEAVEVATGMVVHREHFSGKQFSPDKDLPEMLDRVGKVLDAAARSERRQAVTLLAATARRGMPNQMVLEATLRAAMRHEVDSSPGLIMMSREQSTRLVEEQALTGKQSVWGASHLVEAAVSPVADGKVRVGLRLETIINGSTVKTDANVEGSQDNLAGLVAQAWASLFASAAPETKPQLDEEVAKQNALVEARRLLREAEILQKGKVPAQQVLPLIESAAALGAPHEQVIPLHLDCLFQSLPLYEWHRSSVSNVDTTLERGYKLADDDVLPVTIDRADRVVHALPAVRALLQQAEHYFDIHGRDRLKEPECKRYVGNEYIHVIVALSALRCVFYEDHMPADHREEYEAFIRELDAFTKRYFDELMKMSDISVWRYYRNRLSSHLLCKNPALMDGLLRAILKFESFSLLAHLPKDEKDRRVIRRFLDLIPEHPIPKQRLKQLWLQHAMANPEERHGLMRAAIGQAACLGSKEMGMAPSQIIDERTTSLWFHDRGVPHTASSFIPAFVHCRRMAPDILLRYDQYREMRGLAELNQATIADRADALKKLGCRSSFMKLAEKHKLRQRGGALRQVLLASSLMQLTCGDVSVSMLEERYRAVDHTASGVDGRLFVDFREITGSPNGQACWPMADSSNPSRLWMFFFASSDQVVVASTHQLIVGERPALATPWLLAIDCHSGEVVRRINLKQEVEKATGMQLAGFGSIVWDMQLAQNDDRLLTHYQFIDGNGQSRSGMLVVDKETGKISILPPGVNMRSQTMHSNTSDAAGIGKDFYFLSDKTYHKNASVTAGVGGRAVFHLGPDLKMTALSEHGRRPEQSPFDAIDRTPTFIIANQGKVHVCGEGIFGIYDPSNGTWTADENGGARWRNVVSAEWREVHGPICGIRFNGKPSGWTVRHVTEPLQDALKLDGPDGMERLIPVSLKLPDDFTSETQIMVSKVRGTHGTPFNQKMTFREYQGMKGMQLVVIHQTEDDLMVALQNGQDFQWRPPSRTGRMMPFLWKLSKKELLSALNAQGGGK